MKKTILLLLFLGGFFLFTQAQITKVQNDITLTWNGETLGDTVVISDAPGGLGELLFQAVVHNNTNNGMNVLVARNTISMVEGTDNSFCWPNTCWSPMVDTSGEYGFIPAGGQSSDSAFSGHYSYNDANGNHLYGTSFVKFSFFNKDHPEVIDSVIVKYMLGYTGIEEDSFKGTKVSDIYPNPATSFATIDYHMNNSAQTGKVRIINLVGKLVKEIPMLKREGKVKINLSGLSQGIYFYTVSFDGTIYKTKKLIVKR